MRDKITQSALELILPSQKGSFGMNSSRKAPILYRQGVGCALNAVGLEFRKNFFDRILVTGIAASPRRHKSRRPHPLACDYQDYPHHNVAR